MYVDGETLAQRIARGALPCKEALSCAIQIAEALEAAHVNGIVHRDLKPANVKITSSGAIKVLDLGMAKLREGEGAVSDTQDGTLLGTPAYMSPEQARARPVDSRTDIWAFGCVLYEMLTARAAFTGETIADTIAAVLEREPDYAGLPSTVSPGVRSLLRRCLQKDVTRRLRDIADARFQLEEALAEPGVSVTPVVRAPVATSRLRLVWATIISVAVVAGVAAYFTRPLAEPDELRLEVTTPPTTDLASFAISPDGKQLVFVAGFNGTSHLWLRPLAAVSARPLMGTSGATRPFWSADSRSVGFSANGQLKRIEVDSESVQILASGGSRGGAWSRDGTILFVAGGDPILRVSADGGEPIVTTRVDEQLTLLSSPQFLPDSRHFLFAASGGVPGIYVGQIGASEPPRRIVEAEGGVYARPGHLLFLRQGTLFAQSLDLGRLELEGRPLPLAEQVISPGTGAIALSASAAGPIAYRTGPSDGLSHFAWFDRSGKRLESIVGSDVASPFNSALSPDGRLLATNRNVGRGQQADIWLLDVDRGVPSRFTVDTGFDLIPVWSPDGRFIAFTSNRSGDFDLYVKRADATGTEELLAGGDFGAPSDWSADGRFILVARQVGPADMNNDIWAISVAGDRKPFPVVESTTFSESNAQFSPDGRWVAFQSNQSGRFEIWVQPFPGPGRQTMISSGGGVQARWGQKGDELFYLAPDGRLTAAPVRLNVTAGVVQVGKPVSLFSVPMAGETDDRYARTYTVARDGQRFLVQTTKEVTLPITVLLNWNPER